MNSKQMNESAIVPPIHTQNKPPIPLNTKPSNEMRDDWQWFITNKPDVSLPSISQPSHNSERDGHVRSCQPAMHFQSYDSTWWIADGFATWRKANKENVIHYVCDCIRELCIWPEPKPKRYWKSRWIPCLNNNRKTAVFEKKERTSIRT